MVFAVCVFGNKFLGMLNTCLYSIKQNTNNCNVIVFWQDVDNNLSRLIEKTYPEFKFIQTNFNISGDKIARISSKTIFWEYAAKKIVGLGYTEVCFIDADTLILKDIQYIFKEPFDIAFSVKKECWPLNTGVILANFLNANTLSFFTKWKEETIRIITDREAFGQANSRQYPYGGSDQMSFYQILCYKDDHTEYRKDDISFKAFNSDIFNETRSTKITNNTHIIHYKGGWQKVIIEGGTFSKKRTLADSKEMYILYIKMSEAALEQINNKNSSKLNLKQIGISKPKYLDDSYQIKILEYTIIHFTTNFTTLLQSYFNALLNKFKKVLNYQPFL